MGSKADVIRFIHEKIAVLNSIHGFDYKVKEERLSVGYMMVADAPECCIVYDPQNIIELFLHPEFKRQTQISELEDFIEILLVHEIGHLLDYKENSSMFEEEEHLEQLEVNAWRIGEEIIDKKLLNSFLIFKQLSMEHYKRDEIF